MAERRNWTWDETLVAFRLYCQTPFGKLHQHNPHIVALAEKLGRTPSAVGMKACNFASLDPVHQARGIAGLSNRGRLEEEVWERFHADSDSIADEAEEAYERLGFAEQQPLDLIAPDGPSEQTRTVRVRRIQRFFRAAVLVSYGNSCALTGMSIPSLLNASHIIPWAASNERRADPRNGICLNALHDRAFDRGLISLDDDLRVIISPALGDDRTTGELATVLGRYAGRRLIVPERFAPDPAAIAYHRDQVFRAN